MIKNEPQSIIAWLSTMYSTYYMSNQLSILGGGKHFMRSPTREMLAKLNVLQNDLPPPRNTLAARALYIPSFNGGKE